MSSLVTIVASLRALLMGALQRLREMLWPRPERPAPAWAYAPAPGKRKNALPRPATGPLADPEWRPMWPGNRPRQQPATPDDTSDT
ncbi:MAG TPA: hypothetical protein VH599_14645 [Ktedonobacterales bacterium]|jgi:hypothetical protein